MSNNFAGYLIAKASDTSKIFDPYIQAESFKALPTEKKVIVEYTDDNTLDKTIYMSTGAKTTISFTTRLLHLEKKIEFQALITSCITDSSIDKVYLSYWDDRYNVYKTGYFRLIQPTFTIKTHTQTDITYSPLSISLEEL